jgi:prolipoprotein diacylglyceryltransferase
VARFLTDFLREYDETQLGLTGAQWMMLLVMAAGVWILGWVRRQNAAIDEDEPDPEPEPQLSA